MELSAHTANCSSINFSKYSACGNDFILIDNRSLHFPIDKVATLCQRQEGIGADGLILLEPSQKGDGRMRIFNADGGEAEMCGNGIRCLAKFMQELGIAPQRIRIETMHALLVVELRGEGVSVQMAEPEVEWGVALPSLPPLHRLHTGVPHVVIFVEGLESDKWMQLAPTIRFHPAFGEAGTNVNFAVVEGSTVRLRTYERGVEGETLACGTGATAAAIAASWSFGLKSPVRVLPCSLEPLEISFSWHRGKPTQVAMAGPARFIFRGSINN